METLTLGKHNPRLLDIRKAIDHGTLTHEGFLPIEGPKLLEEAQRSGLEVAAIFMRRGVRMPSLARSVQAYEIEPTAFKSIQSTETSQGLVALVRLERFRLPEVLQVRNPLIVLLARLQDPGNVGTILRVAESFGANACLATAGTVSVLNSKTVRASAGSIFRLPYVWDLDFTQAASKLKTSGIRLIGTSPEGMQTIDTWNWTKPSAIVIGNEGSGLSDEEKSSCDFIANSSQLEGRIIKFSHGGSCRPVRSSQAEEEPPMSGSLFEDDKYQPPIAPPDAPLADRMRPQTLDEVLGQEHVLGSGKPLRTAIERDQVPSMILWGPPGVGKTTIARIIARMTKADFIPFSAVLSGIKEIKEIMAAAERSRKLGRRTILFVDEIHRFNKAQQDAFLPHVEKGNVTLIGATTENPSFEIISALLSRARVMVLNALADNDILSLLHRAVERERFTVDEQPLKAITLLANGDARTALNVLDLAVQGTLPGQPITRETIEQASQKTLLYDKSGEEHFNIISALHKSIRNSDADAALYWLARMLESGEDPLYIARRLVRFASEDIGLADSRALRVALDAKDAFNFLGLPEGKLALAQCVIFLAAAPKSNSVYRAYDAVINDVENTRADPVPLHLRNAPTGLMKNMGYGKGYQYAHDLEEKVADMDCLPDSLMGRKYYHPQDAGAEVEVKRRLDEISRRKKKGDRTSATDDAD